MLGYFWHPFHFAFDRWTLVVMDMMKLHNLHIDRNVPVPMTQFHDNIRPGD
jgi:hypothetical protein